MQRRRQDFGSISIYALCCINREVKLSAQRAARCHTAHLGEAGLLLMITDVCMTLHTVMITDI